MTVTQMKQPRPLTRDDYLNALNTARQQRDSAAVDIEHVKRARDTAADRAYRAKQGARTYNAAGWAKAVSEHETYATERDRLQKVLSEEREKFVALNGKVAEMERALQALRENIAYDVDDAIAAARDYLAEDQYQQKFRRGFLRELLDTMGAPTVKALRPDQVDEFIEALAKLPQMRGDKLDMARANRLINLDHIKEEHIQ